MLPTALLEKILDTVPLGMPVCLSGNARWCVACFYCGRCFLRPGAGHQAGLSHVVREASSLGACVEGPLRDSGQDPDPEGIQSRAAEVEPGQVTCGSKYLLVEAQAQRQAPAVLLVPMLSTQQVFVEVWQGQAGPEVGAQHADWRQHNEGIGHRACSRAGGWSGATPARPGPWLPHPPLLEPPPSQHLAKWPGCRQTGKATQLTTSWSSAPRPTFQGHCPDALLALDVPEANGLVM